MGILPNYHPDALEVVLFMTGVGLLLIALRVATEFQLGGHTIRAPSTRKGQFVAIALGLSAISGAVAITLSKPEWVPQLHGEVLYRPAPGDAAVRQVLVDGADTYILFADSTLKVLRRDGGVATLEIGARPRQIAAGGGAIYLLDETGNVFAYLATEHADTSQAADIIRFDDGTESKQIVAVGDMVYVLKESGRIWKIDTQVISSEVVRDYQQIDDGIQTKQIASAGTGLYVLKTSGQVWAFSPLRNPERPFSLLRTCAEGRAIAADGRALYVIAKDTGHTLECSSSESRPVLNRGVSKQVVAGGGIAYILTNAGEVYRYENESESLTKLRGTRQEAGDDNEQIAPANRGFLATKTNSEVWRYTEFLSRHR